MLTGFLLINYEYAQKERRGEQIDPQKDPRRWLYAEMPERFCWNKVKYRWEHRKRSHKGIGRLVFIGPSAGDLFYLRLLLTEVRGPVSFEALRTVNGNLLPWKDACAALGLLEDDQEWDKCLREACPMNTGPMLRGLFATILLECTPTAPRELWDRYRRWFREDCRHILTNTYLMPLPEDENERIT